MRRLYEGLFLWTILATFSRETNCNNVLVRAELRGRTRRAPNPSQATITAFLSHNSTRWSNSRETCRQIPSIQETKHWERRHHDSFGPLSPSNVRYIGYDNAAFGRILSPFFGSKENDDSSMLLQFRHFLYFFAFGHFATRTRS